MTIGLELGLQQLRAVWIAADGAVEATREVELPWSPDRAGLRASELSRLSAPLRALLRSGPRRTGAAAMALPAQQVPVCFCELDRFSDFNEEERAYTLWRVRQSLPPALRVDHALAYQHIATTAGTDARRFRLLVTAAPEDVVQELWDVMDDAGLEVRGFLPDALAAANVVETALEAQGGVTAWIQLTSSGSVLMLLDAGVPVEYRLLDWGVQRMVAEVASQLGCPADKAREVLASGRLLATKPATAGDVALAGACLVPFFHELQVSLEHQLARVGARGLARVVLAGRGAMVPGLADLLAELLSAPCAPLHAELSGPGLPEGQEGLYAGALGAARALATAPAPAPGGAVKITALLLPAHVRERSSKTFRALRVSMIVLPFVVLAWIAGRWMDTARRAGALEARLAPLLAERARAIGEIRAQLVPAAQAASLESSMVALNATTSAGATGVLEVLPALERELPDGTGLSALIVKTVPGGLQVDLSGAARSERELAAAADRLGRQGIRLRSWRVGPGRGLDWVADGVLAPGGAVADAQGR